ncbi:MAG: hypothetical protein DRI36_01995, partial [Caldiserica bacterium]
DIPEKRKKKISEIEKGFTERELIWIIEILSQTKNKIRWARFPREYVELDLLKIASGYIPIEKLIENLDNIHLSETKETKKEEEGVIEEKRGETDYESMWKNFILFLKKEKSPHYNYLKVARKIVNLKEKKLIFEFPEDKKFNKTLAEKNKENLEKIWERVNGIRWSFDFTIKESEKKKEEHPKLRSTPQQIKEQDPELKKIEEELKELGGFLSGPIDE